MPYETSSETYITELHDDTVALIYRDNFIIFLQLAETEKIIGYHTTYMGILEHWISSEGV